MTFALLLGSITISDLEALVASAETITPDQADALAATFASLLSGLSSDIEYAGSTAGMAEDGEKSLLSYNREMTEEVILFEQFIEKLVASA